MNFDIKNIENYYYSSNIKKKMFKRTFNALKKSNLNIIKKYLR